MDLFNDWKYTYYTNLLYSTSEPNLYTKKLNLLICNNNNSNSLYDINYYFINDVNNPVNIHKDFHEIEFKDKDDKTIEFSYLNKSSILKTKDLSIYHEFSIYLEKMDINLLKYIINTVNNTNYQKHFDDLDRDYDKKIIETMKNTCHISLHIPKKDTKMNCVDNYVKLHFKINNTYIESNINYDYEFKKYYIIYDYQQIKYYDFHDEICIFLKNLKRANICESFIKSNNNNNQNGGDKIKSKYMKYKIKYLSKKSN
jgi:hypothetical protein